MAESERRRVRDVPHSKAHAADLALALAACAGDAWALDRLVQRLACIPAMLQSNHRRLGAPLTQDELTDVEQEAIAAIWKKLPTFAGRSRIETWVYGFCLRELLRSIRRKHRRPNPTDHIEDRLPPSEPGRIDPAIEFEHLFTALDRLGSPAADVIRLKHFEDLTFERIASQLDISPNTAKTWYYRGLRALRGMVQNPEEG